MRAKSNSQMAGAHPSTIVVLLLATVLYAFPARGIASESAVQKHHPIFMLPPDLKWSDSPALPAGVKVSKLYGDLKKAEPVGFRIKLPAGGILAPHTHPVDERVTVITGAFAMGEGEKFDKAALKDLPVGSLAIFPKGCPMFGFARVETVIQVNAEGPWDIVYINPSDDPRLKVPGQSR